MNLSEIQRRLLIHNVDARPLDLAAAGDLQRRWREVYWKVAEGVNEAFVTANDIPKGFDWQVFSCKKRYCLHGAEAGEGYLFLRPLITRFTLVLQSSDHLLLAFDCTAFGLAPRYPAWQDIREIALGAEVYLSPPDFAWTFVVTHEDGDGLRFGPYLAYKNVWSKGDFC